MEQRRLEQLVDCDQTTKVLVDADLALKSPEEETVAARMSAIAQEKVVLEAERVSKVALDTKKEVEQGRTEMEVELEAMKANQAKLIKEANQNRWDDAKADYADQTQELRDGLFVKGWTEALRGTGIEKTSALFKDILVLSIVAAVRAAKANEASLKAKTSEATPSVSPFPSSAKPYTEQARAAPR